jgi:hypothetical protein
VRRKEAFFSEEKKQKTFMSLSRFYTEADVARAGSSRAQRIIATMLAR